MLVSDRQVIQLLSLLFVSFLFGPKGACALDGEYDPSSTPTWLPKVVDFTVNDLKRQREIPIRVFLPAEENVGALPSGAKYEIVLHDAEHSAFTDRRLPGDRKSRNPNHHKVILALSTAFWDANLRKEAGARDWLDGDGPASVLESMDRWQRK